MANFDHLLSVQDTLNRSHVRPERVKEKKKGKGKGSIGSAELRAGKAQDEADDGPTGFDSDESVGGFGEEGFGDDFTDDEDGGDVEGTCTKRTRIIRQNTFILAPLSRGGVRAICIKVYPTLFCGRRIVPFLLRGASEAH